MIIHNQIDLTNVNLPMKNSNDKIYHILVLGDGDMSYSLALARSLLANDVAFELTTSTIDSEEHMFKTYSRFPSILNKLRELRVNAFFEVDAVELHESVERMFGTYKPEFDRIIFNFPHHCGKSKIHLCRQLLEDFFKSSSPYLEPSMGEIWVTLAEGQGGTPAERRKRFPWKNTWQIQDKGAVSGLLLKNVFDAEVAVENLGKSDEELGYLCRGFRNADSAFRSEYALSHVFAFPHPIHCPKTIFPIEWRFSVAIMVEPTSFHVDQLHSIIRQIKPGLRFDTSLLSHYVIPDSGRCTRTYDILFTGITVPLAKSETHCIMLQIREETDKLEIAARATRKRKLEEKSQV